VSRYKVIEHRTGLQEIVNPVANYARQLRERGFVVDVETTGSSKDDEVIELGIVRACNGEVILDQQFKPSKRVEPIAYSVHGISDAQLAGKPPIRELWHEICPLLDGLTCLAWNSSYDSRLLNQTIWKYDLDEPRIEWVCVMKLYKEFRRLPRVCKLEEACDAMRVQKGDHRGVNDALAAGRVLYRMAEATAPDEVIPLRNEAGNEDADETTMPASAFLTEFGWREEPRTVTNPAKRTLKHPDGEETVISEWIDPKGGQICSLLTAMDLQRARM
jgi:DNA polymerase III epsilon subunit-like protein